VTRVPEGRADRRTRAGMEGSTAGLVGLIEIWNSRGSRLLELPRAGIARRT
jgi:hypothetical protein